MEISKAIDLITEQGLRVEEREILRKLRTSENYQCASVDLARAAGLLCGGRSWDRVMQWLRKGRVVRYLGRGVWSLTDEAIEFVGDLDPMTCSMERIAEEYSIRNDGTDWDTQMESWRAIIFDFGEDATLGAVYSSDEEEAGKLADAAIRGIALYWKESGR